MNEWDPDGVSRDDAYDLAAEDRRREVLRILLTDRDEWAVDELATAVAARENEVALEDVDERTHERVVVALLHRDLPKLDDANVVEFDDEEKTVAAGEHIGDLDPLV